MIMNACNLHFTAFQKLVRTWLFAHTAQKSVYDILGRFGLAVSYTSVLKFLRSLPLSAKEVIREKAKTRAFLIIYDNINRMFRAWDPDLTQKDHIHNGTAATYVEIEDCDVDMAFDPQPLKDALDAKKRTALSLDVLYRRVDWHHLNGIMALHCLQFLSNKCPSLVDSRLFVQLELWTAMAVHRMCRGRKTTLHPLATSDLNEGSTAENAKVLEDLLLDQLDLPKGNVA